MSLADLFRGPDPYHADEDELARAVPDESTNLEAHVDICSRRFKAIRKSISAMERSQAANLRLTVFAVLLLIATSAVDMKALLALL